MTEKFQFEPQNLSETIKKNPKEDPVGLFLDRFGVVTNEESTNFCDNIDCSYLNIDERAEALWAVFQDFKGKIFQESRGNIRKEQGLKQDKTITDRKVAKDEKERLHLLLSMLKKLYNDPEVRETYLQAHERHMNEMESINGNLEKFKVLKNIVNDKEILLDEYTRKIFSRRSVTTEVDRLLYKTAKNQLDQSRAQLQELLQSNAELRVLNKYEDTKRYAKELKTEGYMWLPSRRKALEDFEEAALFGRPLLIFGESGTGKTELVKAAALKLTGQIAAETAGKDTRLQDLIAKRDIIGDRTFYRYGEIGRAATGLETTLDEEKKDNGRIVIDDEFNLLSQAEQIERVARVASWKPGRKVMLPQVNEEVTIASNFLYCASVNLASEKYSGGRSEIPLEVMRKFHKTEVDFFTRGEIYDAMLASLMDENYRVRAARAEIGPVFDKKEESRTILKDDQEVKQNVEKWELKEWEEKDNKKIAAGGFVWRLSGAIDELNRSISHKKTILDSKGEGQYLNKILIDIGRLTEWIRNYVVFEYRVSLEQFIIAQIKDQFSEMKSFSQEDRDLIKEFFAHYGIDLSSEVNESVSSFEIMSPRDIGLLSPEVGYEKVVAEEPILTESFYITAEGVKIEYQIERFGQDENVRIPGQIYKDTQTNKFVKFLGVEKNSGNSVYSPYKKEAEKSRKREKISIFHFAQANWQNPETKKQEELTIDLEKNLIEQSAFYKSKLNIEINKDIVKDIWNRNYKEICEQMQEYGYDHILIIPENLPNEEALNNKLIETMEENTGGQKQKVNATWRGENFKTGGSFAGVNNTNIYKYRIILTHSAQNLKDHPILQGTKNKNIIDITRLNESEITSRISNNQELPINCQIKVNNTNIKINAEGLSLKEYLILQAQYFNKTGKHLDESDWTWLLKSLNGSSVVGSSWDPAGRQLRVDAACDVSLRSGRLGLRLSRSFS